METHEIMKKEARSERGEIRGEKGKCYPVGRRKGAYLSLLNVACFVKHHARKKKRKNT